MAIKSKELLRTSQAWDGAALPAYPIDHPELRASRMEFPVGAKTGWHHHTVINFGIVEQGELTIVCQDGTERTFHEGEALVEVVGTIHRGENRGPKPVILNMFYVSAPEIEITVQHPELDDVPVAQESVGTPSQYNATLPSPVTKEDERVQKLVMVIGKDVLPRRQIIADLGLRQKSRRNFCDNYLHPAYAKGYVVFAYPNSPNKPEQAYRLTAKGLEFFQLLTQEKERSKALEVLINRSKHVEGACHIKEQGI